MFWRQTTNNENQYQAKRAMQALLQERRPARSVRLYFEGRDFADLEKAAMLARNGQIDAARTLVQQVVQ